MPEKGLCTRIYSTRDQVPDRPVFTHAKNKLRLVITIFKCTSSYTLLNGCSSGDLFILICRHIRFWLGWILWMLVKDFLQPFGKFFFYLIISVSIVYVLFCYRPSSYVIFPNLLLFYVPRILYESFGCFILFWVSSPFWFRFDQYF